MRARACVVAGDCGHQLVHRCTYFGGRNCKPRPLTVLHVMAVWVCLQRLPAASHACLQERGLHLCGAAGPQAAVPRQGLRTPAQPHHQGAHAHAHSRCRCRCRMPPWPWMHGGPVQLSAVRAGHGQGASGAACSHSCIVRLASQRGAGTEDGGGTSLVCIWRACSLCCQRPVAFGGGCSDLPAPIAVFAG